MCDDSGHVERVFHIEEMKAELAELSQGHMLIHSEEALPPDLEEQSSKACWRSKMPSR